MKDRELKRYKSALWQYRLSLYLPKFLFSTKSGFCLHLKTWEDNSSLEETLPILYSLKPVTYNAYWFPEGELKPRIELLKQAIKIYKEQNKY